MTVPPATPATFTLHDRDGVEPHETATVARGVVRVPVASATLPPATRTNAYLVCGDDAVWLVDAGSAVAAEQARLAAAAAEVCALWRRPFGGQILTHHHPDHVAGVAAAHHELGGDIVCTAVTASIVADLPSDPRTVEGDARLDGLALVFTPGHAPGHVCVWTGDRDTPARGGRVLLAGDLVAGYGTILVNPPRGNMSAYLASLQRAIDLNPALLLPAHGPGTMAAVERLEATRTHRLAREQKVLAATPRDTPTSLDDITLVAYDDTPPMFIAIAARSALAHLVRLVDEGQVVETKDGFRRVDRERASP